MERPEDILKAQDAARSDISLYVREIETDHKPGPDGNLVAFDTIVFGKKGTNNYEQRYEIERLKKQNPVLWEWCRGLYERWKESQTIVRDGLDLKAWPAITKGQISACHGLGLYTVEDLTTATSSIREKLGIGAGELIEKAKAFVNNKEASAQANKIAAQDAEIAQLRADLDEARKTMDALAAKQGKSPQKPRLERAA